MSDQNQARRTTAELAFAGTDITDSIRPYLLSLTYTDNEEDEADDLQLKLQDRDGLWLEKWLNDAVQGAASGLPVHAVILRENWNGNGADHVLDCGTFELDSIKASGPPAVITLKATALPYRAQIRQTQKTKAWEAYHLSGIAREMAQSNGMACLYESADDPFYQRVEQFKTSDISFLSLSVSVSSALYSHSIEILRNTMSSTLSCRSANCSALSSMSLSKESSLLGMTCLICPFSSIRNLSAFRSLSK